MCIKLYWFHQKLSVVRVREGPLITGKITIEYEENIWDFKKLSDYERVSVYLKCPLGQVFTIYTVSNRIITPVFLCLKMHPLVNMNLSFKQKCLKCMSGLNLFRYPCIP